MANPGNKKVVVITGGTHGIGQALVEIFKANDFIVAAVARNSTDGVNYDYFFSCDLAIEAEREKLAAELTEKFDHIDCLINNAGIGSYAKNSELPLSFLHRLMEINYFAPVDLSCRLLEKIEKCHGAIVNISSIAGLMPVACMGAYSSSKAALQMFSETLRMENKNIRVLTVFPGRINTGFSIRAIKIRPVPETPGNNSSSAAVLAKKIYKFCSEKNRQERLIYPAWYHLVLIFSRLFPKLYRYGNQKAWKLK